MKKFLLGAFALLALAMIAVPASTGLSQTSSQQPFLVYEEEYQSGNERTGKTRASIPGIMLYPREFEDQIAIVEYNHFGPTSTIKERGLCSRSLSQDHVVADWLNVPAQYVTALDESKAFAIELPEPRWIKIDFGRLQYMENAEIVSADGLLDSREILVQNATWRCISKHDSSIPRKPMTNVKFVNSKSAPSNGDEVTLNIDEVQSWCTANCEALKLERLVEDNGQANPRGVKLGLMGKQCPVFNVPEGISWDDDKGHHQGPDQNVTICTAAFRR